MTEDITHYQEVCQDVGQQVPDKICQEVGQEVSLKLPWGQVRGLQWGNVSNPSKVISLASSISLSGIQGPSYNGFLFQYIFLSSFACIHWKAEEYRRSASFSLYS